MALTSLAGSRPCWSTCEPPHGYRRIAMVNFCAVFGCGNRGDRNKDKHFFRLPSVVTHQGEQTLNLTTRRRAEWLRRICRNDLRPANYPYTRVCSDHFVSGSPSSLYDTGNPDWAPSLKLGYASASQTIEAEVSGCVGVESDASFIRLACLPRKSIFLTGA